MNEVIMTADQFYLSFPEFSNVTDEQLESLFKLSTLYIENNQLSVVTDLKKRELLLYLIVAHLCYLKYGNNKGDGGTGMVGRLSSATEGSVSISATVGQLSSDAEWYAQSQYGWQFWEATKVYRMGTWFSGADYY